MDGAGGLPFDDPAALLDASTCPPLAFPDPPGIGEPGPPALHLVCTNGRHDPCCADLGRPVVRALVAARAPDVWECSHIGGDRFAANLVCLPDGVYYGRVDPDGAPGLVADHRAGLDRPRPLPGPELPIRRWSRRPRCSPGSTSTSAGSTA